MAVGRTRKDTRVQRFVEGKELPDMWFVFDERGEYHADIAQDAIMVKHGEQHNDIIEFIGDMGTVVKMTNSTIVKNVNEEEAVKEFKAQGYIVTKANDEDFIELQRELDKLLTQTE